MSTYYSFIFTYKWKFNVNIHVAMYNIFMFKMCTLHRHVPIICIIIAKLLKTNITNIFILKLYSLILL